MSNRRVVLVTGSSSGIGLATSLAFARAGDTVIATMRDPRRSAQLIAAANSARLAVQVRALDVTSDASVEAAFSSVVGEYGQVDVVVNNAGIGIPGTLEDLEMADIMRSLEVNFLGVARVTKAALPIMRKLGGGRIIAVSSTAGLVGTPFNDAYCAAKHALEGLFESLQPVAASLGVYVTLVEPGPTATGFYDPSKIPVSADPAIAALQVRLRRIVEPMMARG